MAAVRSNLAEVLLTQGYQDLSGQIIRGVMTLVDELEEALGELVRIAGRAGWRVAAGAMPSNRRGHGPMVPGIDHGACRQRPAGRRCAAVGSRNVAR